MFLDRRQFLASGALAAAALALGASPGAAASPEAARRRTLRALSDGLAQVPAGRFRGLDGGNALRAYDAWYATADGSLRAHADTVLDGLAGFRGHPRELAQRPDAAALLAAGIGLVALVTEPTDDARADAPAI